MPESVEKVLNTLRTEKNSLKIDNQSLEQTLHHARNKVKDLERSVKVANYEIEKQKTSLQQAQKVIEVYERTANEKSAQQTEKTFGDVCEKNSEAITESILESLDKAAPGVVIRTDLRLLIPAIALEIARNRTNINEFFSKRG